MSDNIRVIFVDDDPFLLQAQRRMLWGVKEWKTEFVDSGEKALAMMTEQPFDVVVSDMRMPIMDGLQLLTEVQKLFPRTVRIILSGQTEQEEEIRAFGPAQRYLSKPCESTELRAVINRSVVLQQSLRHDAFETLLNDKPELLTLPNDIQDAIRLAQVPQTQKSDVANLVQQNAKFGAMFLLFANTTSCTTGEPFRDVESAVESLAWDLLRPLLLSAGCFANVCGSVNDEPWLSDLAESSTRLGCMSLTIARQENSNPESSSHAMTAGLLHELGSLVYSQHFPEKHTNVAASKTIEERLEAQTAVFGINQYQFAACLLQRWGLPNAIVEAVALGSTDSIEDLQDAEEQPIPVFAIREAFLSECPVPVL